MITDLNEIRVFFKDQLKKQGEILKVKVDSESNFEVKGTVEAMQGKQKVDGIYFASVVPKAKDVRLYFFPIYTHRVQLEKFLTPELDKCLKGKSCFHIKKITPEMQVDFSNLISESVRVYKSVGLL